MQINKTKSGVTRRAAFAGVFAAALSLTAAGCGGGGGDDNNSNNTFNGNSNGDPVRVCSAGAFEPSFAGRTTLRRWKNLPVNVYFANTVTYVGQDLQPTVQAGFDSWNARTDGKIPYRLVNTEGEADVVVTLQKFETAPLNNLGSTAIEFRNNNSLTKARITLAVFNNSSPEENGRGLRTRAAEQWGHALGIEGTSDNPADLLSNQTRPLDADILPTERDANTLKTAYCAEFGRAVATANVCR